MDFIKQLGTLAFGSRLRRLADRLMRDVARVYADLNVEFEPRWFPVLYFLEQNSPSSISDVASALGLTHPAVIQVSQDLIRRKLVKPTRDSRDERKRMLSITRKGQALYATLLPIWREIQQATDDVLHESGYRVLDTLTAIEARLDHEDVYRRVRRRLGKSEEDGVEIVGYQPKYQRYFRRLNLEWLRKNFSVEPEDEKVLSDPEGEILATGGAILFAKAGKEIVGACGLLRLDNNTFELTKMAVTPKAQGRRIGWRLAEAALAQALALGATKVVLETSPKLEAAVQLYRKLGFVQLPDNPDSKFRRCSIRMELLLKKAGKQKSRRKRA